MSAEKELLERLERIKRWARGDERAPHKPLLLLMALSRIQRGEERLVAFSDLEYDLRALLEAFGPSRKSHHPEFPFWHLQSDGLWEIPGRELLTPKKGGASPTAGTLRENEAAGGLPERYDALLRRKPGLVATAARSILSAHFPESLYDDLVAAVGLDLAAGLPAQRDPAFRSMVLLAYEYRCAVCGFKAAMENRLFGVEAAHVKWHSHNGPSMLANGIGLCTLHHKAFDLGVIGLTDDDRVLVSARFNGNDEAAHHFLPHAGRELLGPQPGHPRPALEFKKWHLENCFKGPARHSVG